MFYVTIAVLLVLGFLGAINLIAARKPEAKKLAAKLAPYQGWIGAGAAIWGVYFLIRWFGYGIEGLSVVPVLSLTSLAAALLLIGLGTIFGLGIFKQFVKAEAPREKLDTLVGKLLPMQSTLGLAAIAVGAWFLVANLFNIYI